MTDLIIDEQTIDVTVVEDVITLNVYGGVPSGGGASDVDDLTTESGTDGQYVNVATDGGLQYRDPTDVLSDIGAEPTIAGGTSTQVWNGLKSFVTGVWLNVANTWSAIQTFSAGIVTGVIKPADDAPDAVQIQDAGGDPIMEFNTTNHAVGIGVSPVPDRILSALGTIRIDGGTDGDGDHGLELTYGDNVKAVWQIQDVYDYVRLRGYGNGFSFGNNASADMIVMRSNATGVSIGHTTHGSAYADVAASTTAAASLRLRDGVAPTSPNDGDIWQDGADLLARIDGATYGLIQDPIAHAAAIYSLAHPLPTVPTSSDSGVDAAMQALADAGIIMYGWQYIFNDRATHDLSGVAGDSVWYPEVIDRQPGQVVFFDTTITDVAQTIEFGFDTNQAGSIDANALRITGGDLKPTDSGAVGPDIAYPASGTPYQLAVILRAAGAFYLQDDVLMAIHGSDTSTPVYAGFANTSATGTVDGVRAPVDLWAPKPIAADTGTVVVPTIADAGSNGLDATVVDVGLGGSGVYLGNETSRITVPLDESVFDGDAGTLLLYVDYDGVPPAETYPVRIGFNDDELYIKARTDGKFWFAREGSGTGIPYREIAPSTTTGAMGMVWDQVSATNELSAYFSENSSTQSPHDGAWGGTYDTFKIFGEVVEKSVFARDFILTPHVSTASEVSALITKIEARELTSSDLDTVFGAGNYMWLPMDENYTTDGGTITDPIEQGGDGVAWSGYTWRNDPDGSRNTDPYDDRLIAAGTPYIYAEAEGTIGGGEVGIVLMSDGDGLNKITVTHDGTSCIGTKYLAGVPSNLFTVAAAEVPGVLPTATTRDNGDGTAQLWVWYDGAFIAEQEIADAEIVGNTQYGVFSTSDTNRITNFTAYNTGGHEIPGA